MLPATVMDSTTCLVTGAAGFIGSHLVDRLLARGSRVVGVDNFLLGTRANLVEACAHPAFTLLEEDVNRFEALQAKLAAAGFGRIDEVWHLAANSDIRAGTADPEVDLKYTFLTTFNVLRLMKAMSIRRLAFASTSAIYGDRPHAVAEDDGPLRPISNYGAMKLASEGVISAGLETFLERAWVFRFPNVIGPRATHGVIHDFLLRLKANPKELTVLGNGTQEKPYLHVSELVEAMLHIHDLGKEAFTCCNIGPDGTATTVRHIAESVVNFAAPGAAIRYGDSAKGWPGDVPKFRYSIERLRQLGWTPKLTSNQAIERAIPEIATEVSRLPISP